MNRFRFGLTTDGLEELLALLKVEDVFFFDELFDREAIMEGNFGWVKKRIMTDKTRTALLSQQTISIEKTGVMIHGSDCDIIEYVETVLQWERGENSEEVARMFHTVSVRLRAIRWFLHYNVCWRSMQLTL